jgi:hypothetical protein
MNAAGTPLQKRENPRSIFGVGVLRGCLTLALLIGLGVTSCADDSSEKAKGKTDAVAVDQEATALAFAGEHHPELKTLVESLKTANPAGYKKAIHDLHKTSDRLGKLNSDKSKGRYEHELALWKLDSRIRLTAARSAMKDTEELRAELKSLIEQRHALNLQWLKSDKERTAARLAKLEAELKAAEEKLPQAVDAEVDRLLKSVKTNKPKVTAALKDAKKKNDTKKDGPAPAPKPAEPPPQP